MIKGHYRSVGEEEELKTEKRNSKNKMKKR